MQVWAAYSPVKNSPEDARAKASAGGPSHSATTGELDIYQANCRHAQCTCSPTVVPQGSSQAIMSEHALPIWVSCQVRSCMVCKCTVDCMFTVTGSELMGFSCGMACCTRTLQMLGATIEGPESRSFNGLDVQLWPRVSWSPLFALTIADLQVCATHLAGSMCMPHKWIED